MCKANLRYPVIIIHLKNAFARFTLNTGLKAPNPNQLLQNYPNPRGLGLAVLFGALTGLTGWVLAFVAERLDLAKLIHKMELSLSSEISTDLSTQPKRRN